MRYVQSRMAHAKLRIEGDAGAELTVAPTFLSFVCENVVEGQPCGAWITPRLDQQLPDCDRCKAAAKRLRLPAPPRVWRVATKAEIEDYDRRFQERYERDGEPA